jgi:hypothetical protein
MVTVYDLLDRLNDLGQRHSDIGEWTMHVEVPDGCKAWEQALRGCLKRGQTPC